MEGDGDQLAVPIVVRNHLLLNGSTLEVGKPINAKGRGNLLREGQLERWLHLAALDADTCGVFVVCDAETDAACILGPALIKRCASALPQVPVRVTLAVRQFENWIIASRETVHGGEFEDIDDYEAARAVKMIREWRRPRSYVKPLHQPGYAARLDQSLVAARCPSFVRLLRCIDELVSECAKS